MSWQVLIDYGTGWVDLTSYGGTDLVRNTLKLSDKLYTKDFKPALSSATFSATMDSTLAGNLIASTDDIRCRINKDAVVWFDGFTRPITNFIVKSDKAIEFEVFDYGYLLDKSLQADFLVDNYKVCDPADTDNSIVHLLLESAGYPTGQVAITTTISDTIQLLTFSKGKKYSDVIGTLLFDFHHTFFVDHSGNLNIYDWAPSSVSPADTITESDIISQLQLSRDDIEDDQVRVIYNKYGFIENHTLIYEKATKTGYGKFIGITRGGEDANTDAGYNASSITWPSTDYKTFQYTLPDSEDNNLEILKIENPVLSLSGYRFYEDSKLFGLITFTNYKKSTSHLTLLEETYGPSSATLQWTINPGALRKIKLTSDLSVVYKGENKTSVYSIDGATGRLKEYESEYIYDDETAKALASALISVMEYGRFNYSFSSIEDYSLGEYYTLTSTSLNTSGDIRIIGRQYDEITKIWNYDATSVGESSVVAGSIIEGGGFIPYNQDEYTAIANSVGAGLESDGTITQPISGFSIGDIVTPDVAGLYFTNSHIGFFDGSVWRSIINNDGTFKFETPDGDFIEWSDGSDLEIQGSVQSADYSVGSDGWRIDREGDAEFNNVTVRGEVEATSGTIGGFEILSNMIKDSDNRVKINSDEKRFEVYDSVGNIKAAIGYLDNIGSYTSSDYGLWVGAPNTVHIEGDAEYAAGDWTVNSDASFVIKDGSDVVIARLGTADGEVGLFINEEALSTEYSAKLTADEFFVGTDTSNIRYDAVTSSLILELVSFMVSSLATSIKGYLEISNAGTVDALTDPVTITTFDDEGTIKGRISQDNEIEIASDVSVVGGLSAGDGLMLVKGDSGVAGPAGAQGDAGSITVGTVESGVTPAVVNSGTTNEAVFDFTLAKGDTGERGDAGTLSTGSPFYTGPQVINTDITIGTADDNHMTIGPITIADGVTVTVDGGRWVII